VHALAVLVAPGPGVAPAAGVGVEQEISAPREQGGVEFEPLALELGGRERQVAARKPGGLVRGEPFPDREALEAASPLQFRNAVEFERLVARRDEDPVALVAFVGVTLP